MTDDQVPSTEPDGDSDPGTFPSPQAPDEVFAASVVSEPGVPAETPGTLPVPREKPPQPGLLASLGVIFLALFSQFTVSLAVVVIATIVLTSTGRTPYQAATYLTEHEELFFPVGTFTMLLAALGIAFIFYGRDTSRALGWRLFSFRQGLATLLLLVPLGILASEFTNVVAEIVTEIQPEWLKSAREKSTETFSSFSEASFLLVFVSGCILPGIGEEILCRGFMGRGLLARYGLWAGTLLTSFLFGMMHIEPVQALGAFVLGAGLHYVFLATKSLAAAMFGHALNNTIAFMLMRYSAEFPVPGISHPEEGVHTPIYLLVAATAALACSGVLLFQSRTRWMQENGEEWFPGYASGERPPASVTATPMESKPAWVINIASWATFVLMIVAMIISAR